MLTVGQIGDLQLTTATMYCPARGPTFPNARTLSEDMLLPVLENLVLAEPAPEPY